MSPPPTENPEALRSIKLLHTAVWAVFAGSILAIPVASALDAHRVAALLILLVLGEVVVLAFNGWACPLTAIAARYTADRRPNFDIYLPVWLARYNKHIFGPLFAAGMVFALLRWWGAG